MAMFFTISYIFTILYTLSSAQTTTDYCQLSCSGKNHTVCLRKNVNCGAGPTCGPNYRPILLTDTDRKFILDIHNILRNRVASGQETTGAQPSASNMNAFCYSKELETIAQCHTNNCTFAHDACRRTAPYSWVGQNIAYRSYYGSVGDQKTATNASIYAWYNEVKDFNNTWVASYGNYPTTKVVGHYTQFVWAKTIKVGCGMTFYTDASNWNYWLIGCNYAFGGNILGQSVYQVGPPASACGSLGVNPNYPALCGPDNILDS
ncbi:venom allergen 3 [Diabrotica virgifera virgifera]|uniref:SCP domain-containing protein n=2 Tax=Diabrotica virgifera virgifera TaxID=50390 RepID=A0ABM5L846_DIAVI|nr:venom allergen 3 [Diabrotica virgifera virgifera]